MAQVRFERVSKSFGDHEVIPPFDLNIADREFLVLVGPSGCGKSTLLRMLAGLEETTAGQIYIDDRPVNHLPPKDRDIAMVFQNYALYPHMNVYRNMAFGLKMRGFKKNEIDVRVREAARILEMDDLLHRKPAQLSGGQRQRVAMGRAIVRKPKVFLFDEPLSNLDAKLRVQMRLEIRRLHQRLETTVVYVTHDQVEAMTLADRIAVIDRGVLQQVAAPHEVYDRPANLFVAGFIGSPPINLLPARIADENGVREIAAESFRWSAPQRLAAPSSPDVTIGIRPEHLSVTPRAGRSEAAVEAVAELVEALGSFSVVYARAGERLLGMVVDLETKVHPGDRVTLHLDLEHAHIFDGQTGRNLSLGG